MVTLTGTNDAVEMHDADLRGRVKEAKGRPAVGAQLSDTGKVKVSDAGRQ
jgi:hypothetical protein